MITFQGRFALLLCRVLSSTVTCIKKVPSEIRHNFFAIGPILLSFGGHQECYCPISEKKFQIFFRLTKNRKYVYRKTKHFQKWKICMLQQSEVKSHFVTTYIHLHYILLSFVSRDLVLCGSSSVRFDQTHKGLMVLIVFITLRREFWITNPRSGLAVHQLGEELRLNGFPWFPHHCSMISRLSIMIYDICLLSWCIVRFFRFRFSAFRLPLFRGNCVWWTDSLDTPNGQISFPKDFWHCV